ncbi:flavin monoamine oxidase family protein [Dactylosporangium sp. CA-052675]|uniref:flavin monoamine oxidase family protein n=1 Tax=Dactylosporangium sp. CA-052675 TaxID=3239927 RepID=UPI003D9271B6
MRVVVVGAGLAGLTAATRLAEAGADVTVLEARDRVGGRTHGLEVAPGAWVDAGAAYLGERHTALLDLLARLGLKTVPTGMDGASRFALHGDAVEQRDGRFPPLAAVALGDLFDRLDALTRRVDPAAPWATEGAAALDTLTADAWARANLTHPDARAFFPLFLGEMMAAAPEDVSVLHMAFYLRSGGGLRYLNAFAGGAQESRVDGGAHQACELLAERLAGRVVLGRPVTSVHQDAHGVTVDGRYRADAVVVAVPPLLADAIDFRPGLPAPRSGQATAPGCAVKVHLVHPSPLWREQGLSGWSVSAQGPLTSTVDDSPAGGGAGVLTGFVTGADAHRFAALGERERRAAATAQAARLFPGLPEPIAVHVTDWVHERWSRGCYAALMGPGDWLATGPRLTERHHRVHWAGTETSTEFFGLMEGAIRSGHRAALSVLEEHDA